MVRALRIGVAFTVIGVALVAIALFGITIPEATYYYTATPAENVPEGATVQAFETVEEAAQPSLRPAIQSGSMVEIDPSLPEIHGYVRYQDEVYSVSTLTASPDESMVPVKLGTFIAGSITAVVGVGITAVGLWRRYLR